MAVSQSDIDALNAALKNGERVVKSDGVLVEYRSVDDIIRARDSLVGQMAAESGQARPKQTIMVHGGRGFRGA
jgi:hypothetical protein